MKPKIRVLKACIRKTAASLGLLVLTAACFGFVPTASLGQKHSHSISAAQRKAICPGKTSRNEVIARLGTNYVMLPDRHAIAYSWENRGLDLGVNAYLFKWYVIDPNHSENKYAVSLGRTRHAFL